MPVSVVPVPVSLVRVSMVPVSMVPVSFRSSNGKVRSPVSKTLGSGMERGPVPVAGSDGFTGVVPGAGSVPGAWTGFTSTVGTGIRTDCGPGRCPSGVASPLTGPVPGSTPVLPGPVTVRGGPSLPFGGSVPGVPAGSATNPWGRFGSCQVSWPAPLRTTSGVGVEGVDGGVSLPGW